MNKRILLGVLGVLAVQSPTVAQNTAPATGDAKEIIQKTFAAYASAKSYQGNWVYTLERGQATQKMTMEIKAKGPTHLYFKVAAAPGQKAAPGTETIPEMLVVLDGKSAWFYNGGENVFFKVTLPKNAVGSPLMFIPQIPAASAVQRAADLQDNGKTYFVLQTETTSGGTSRMEIESDTYHIHRIIVENTIAFIKVLSTITVEKESFNAEASENSFSFKIPKGAKEIPAPPGAAAMFGPADKD